MWKCLYFPNFFYYSNSYYRFNLNKYLSDVDGIDDDDLIARVRKFDCESWRGRNFEGLFVRWIYGADSRKTCKCVCSILRYLNPALKNVKLRLESRNWLLSLVKPSVEVIDEVPATPIASASSSVAPSNDRDVDNETADINNEPDVQSADAVRNYFTNYVKNIGNRLLTRGEEDMTTIERYCGFFTSYFNSPEVRLSHPNRVFLNNEKNNQKGDKLTFFRTLRTDAGITKATHGQSKVNCISIGIRKGYERYVDSLGGIVHNPVGRPTKKLRVA